MKLQPTRDPSLVELLPLVRKLVGQVLRETEVNADETSSKAFF
jgi:hypothetical protein